MRDLARFLSERDRGSDAAAVIDEAIPHVRKTAPLIDLRRELGLE
ncbi:MAG TPA: hypothetical protein VFN44_15815 [Solirubrobacteraceae bacterium]|nr:hypothetical protein [Solirubrobacteraceae bacterium]